MRLITCHVPEFFLDCINDLIRAGRFPNRSEFIRHAVREMLRVEIRSLKGELDHKNKINDVEGIANVEVAINALLETLNKQYRRIDW